MFSLTIEALVLVFAWFKCVLLTCKGIPTHKWNNSVKYKTYKLISKDAVLGYTDSADGYLHLYFGNTKNTITWNTALHVHLFDYIRNSSRDSHNDDDWLKNMYIMKCKLSKLVCPTNVQYTYYRFQLSILVELRMFSSRRASCLCGVYVCIIYILLIIIIWYKLTLSSAGRLFILVLFAGRLNFWEQLFLKRKWFLKWNKQSWNQKQIKQHITVSKM